MNRIVLASRSPQRLALLNGIGLEVEVIESGVEECTDGDPRGLVEANALAKASAVAKLSESQGAVVIGGDTEVVLDSRALGQPESAEEAREMLLALSGREHRVLGGLCVISPEEEPRLGVEETSVLFRALDGELIDAYLSGGEWRGRAGGYAVQGAGSGLVERVDGDLSNVIGLPLGLIARLAPELLRSTRQN